MLDVGAVILLLQTADKRCFVALENRQPSNSNFVLFATQVVGLTVGHQLDDPLT